MRNGSSFPASSQSRKSSSAGRAESSVAAGRLNFTRPGAAISKCCSVCQPPGSAAFAASPMASTNPPRIFVAESIFVFIFGLGFPGGCGKEFLIRERREHRDHRDADERADAVERTKAGEVVKK